MLRKMLILDKPELVLICVQMNLDQIVFFPIKIIASMAIQNMLVPRRTQSAKHVLDTAR